MRKRSNVLCNTNLSMGKKGVRSSKGQPEAYDEVKTRINLSLSPTAVKGLDELTSAIGLASRSDLIEQIGRRLLPIGTIHSFTEQEVHTLGKHWNTSLP